MSQVIATASALATVAPGLELELRTDTQYASAYLHGAPFATVRRRHAFDPAGSPPWQVWFGNDPDSYRAHTARGVVRLVARKASQAGA